MSFRNTTRNVLVLFIIISSISVTGASCPNTHKANHNSVFEAIVDYDFSAKEIASEFKLVSAVIKQDSYWKGLLISNSANFENSNQFVGYHIVNSKQIRIYQETGEMSTTSFKELSKYECHFFNNGLPKKIDTSGKLNGNLDEIEAKQKISDLKTVVDSWHFSPMLFTGTEFVRYL